MKNVTLLLSTANDIATAAIVVNEKLIFSETSSQHSTCESLCVMINNCLLHTDITLNRITRVVLNIGPGGFTATRTAISLLSPIWQIYQFEIIAIPATYFLISAIDHKSQNNYIALIQGKRNEGFYQVFNGCNSISSIALTSIGKESLASIAVNNNCDRIITNCKTAIEECDSDLSMKFTTFTPELLHKSYNLLNENKTLHQFRCLDLINALYCKEPDALSLLERGIVCE